MSEVVMEGERLSLRDLYWVAGLLEGEGCFIYNNCVTVMLTMTDRDVVERYAGLLHAPLPKAYPSQCKSEKCKLPWRVTFTGPRAVGLAMTVYALMGVRRKAKIREVLSEWRRARRVLPPWVTWGICKTCKTRMERRRKGGLGGLRTYCPPCERKYNTEWARKHRREARLVVAGGRMQ